MTPDLDTLLREDALVDFDGQRYRLGQHEVGLLLMPTGQVWAGEPLMPRYHIKPYTVAVKPGQYRVVGIMAVNLVSNADRYVAGLQLVVRDEAVAAWELAVLPGTDPASLGEDEFVGYAVDGGTACFADAVGGYELASAEDDTICESIIEKLDRNPWAMQELHPDTRANVAVTSTNGDGIFGTWIGRTAEGEVACFVTQFGVV